MINNNITENRNNQTYMKLVQKIGQMIREARIKKGVTQQDLCNQVNSTLPQDKHIIRQTLVSLETGTMRRMPLEEKMLAIYSVLGISVTKIDSLTDDDTSEEADDELKSHDVLPLLRVIAGSDSKALTYEQFRHLCQADLRCKAVGVDIMTLFAK